MNTSAVRSAAIAVAVVSVIVLSAIALVSVRASADTPPTPDLLSVDFAGGSPADTAQGLTETAVGSPAPSIAEDPSAARQVASFDGTQNAFTYDMGTEWPTISDAISLECYFRYDGTPSGATGTGSNGKSVCSDKQSGGFAITVVGTSVEFQVAAASTSYTLATAPLNGDTWYDAVGTYDGTDVDLYLNGHLAAQTPASGAIHAPATGGTHFVLGADASAGTLDSVESFGPVSIATVGIYSSALTADQVTALYQAADVPTSTASPTTSSSPTEAPSSPASSPTGTGTAGPAPTLDPDVLDVDFASGAPIDHAHAIPAKQIGSPTIAPDSRLGTDAATFDGTSDAYGFDLSPYWPDLADAATVECVFKYNGTLTSGSGSSGPSVCSDKNGGGYGFVLVGNQFSFEGDIGGTYQQAATTLPAANTWYDAVGVYDGAHLTLYLNGVQVGQTTATGPITLPGTAGRDFNLGADVSATDGAENYIAASVATARIWSGALSPAQVSALYAQNVSTQPVGAGDVLDVSFASGAPIEYANGLPAKKIGSPTIAPDPTLGSDVATFNGTSDAYGFDLSSRWSSLADSVTIQCVFKYNGTLTSGSGSSGPSVCSDKNGGGYGFVLVGNQFSFEGDIGGTYQQAATTLPAANTWYDAVGVYDGAHLTLYLNGVQVGQTTATGPITLPGTAGRDFNLGADVSATDGAENYIAASVEQAQIWSRPLSPGQVAQLDKTALNPIPAAASQLVISALYGGGGDPGSYFANDFVELLNSSQTTSVSLGGLSVQELAADGTPIPGATTPLDDVTLAPGQYFLLAGHDTGQGDESDLSVAADQTAPSLDITDGAATVALVDGTSQVTSLPGSGVIDSVSAGTTGYALGVPAPALSATAGDYRNDSGCANTHDNGRDFSSQTAQTTPLYDTGSAPQVCTATVPTTFSETALSPSTGNAAAVAADGNGALDVAETASSKIVSMTTGGSSATTIAGGSGIGDSGEGGAATAALLMYPAGVAVDAHGDIFVSDTGNNEVREIRASDGTIVRYAGTGTGGYAGDGGQATDAELYDPQGLAVDAAGDLLIADSGNNVIREVTPSGTISTVAGDGTFGYAGDGGPATSARLATPYGVAVDSAGNVYIADSANNVVRRVDAVDATISTVAGDHAAYVANDYVPADSGDGGPAIHAQLNDPQGVALDAAGNLYIADTANKAVRLVTPTGTISTMAQNPPIQPEGITVDDSTGDVFVADANSSHIDEISGMPVPSAPAPGPEGARLAFTTQPPTSVTAGQSFTVTVAAEDAAGHVDPAATGTLTLAVTGVPADALTCDGGLGGALSGGALTYTCTVSQQAAGLALTASADGYAAVTSATFDVTGSAPAAPTGVRAQAGDGTALVSWASEQGVTGYEVYAGTASQGEDLSSPACTAGPTATSCQVAGLTDQTTYWFEVVAVNGTQTSTPSVETEATPLAVPPAPSGLTIRPGDGAVTLSWTAPSPDGSAQITGYAVYEATTSGGEDMAGTPAATTTGATSVTIDGLSDGVPYWFVVVATTAAGDSQPSTEVSATPARVSAAPTRLSATAGIGEVSLTWSAPADDGGTPVLGYAVYDATTRGGERLQGQPAAVTTGATRARIDHLRNGTMYYFVVVARNARGSSPASTEVGATPVLPVHRVTLVAARTPRSVTYGTTVTLRATLRDATAGRPLADAAVTVQHRVDGTWRRLGTVHTNARGAATYDIRATAAASYRFGTAGRTTGSARYTSATSGTVSISVRVRSARPRIIGTPRPGTRVRAHPGRWEPSGMRFGYQWLVNGRPIHGATGATYRPARSLRGRRLSVRVTGLEHGYLAATATSTVKRIK